MSNFEQSPIGHRCSLWADVKELYGPRSFCSSGGAAVYSYTGKVLLIHSLRHIYFLNGVHTESQVIRPAPARFFTLYLQSALVRNARLPAARNFSPMKLRDRLEPQRYEQRLQETRWERKAETKQVERLSAILVKKASSAKAKGIPDRAA